MLCDCPRSTRFFTTMPAAELGIVHRFLFNGWKLAPTGSRFICPRQFVRDNSDWDVMVLMQDGLSGQPVTNWGGLDVTGTKSNNEWHSYRAGMLNLIYLDINKWQAWNEATAFAVECTACWRSREKRVELFAEMERVVIHRSLDAIMNKRQSPMQAMAAARRRHWSLES